MLLRFYVSNFMSFAEEVEFNMFPGAFKTHKNHIYVNKKEKVDLLKSAAIYGANGSGKSNFIRAVHFLHDVVVKGDLLENEVKSTTFRLDHNMDQKPSEFGLECQVGSRFFEYAVSIREGKILEETVFETFPAKGKEELIFSRKTENEKASIEVNPLFIQSDKERYRYEIYSEDLKPWESLIYKIQDKLEAASLVFNWFKENLWVVYPESVYFLTLRLCIDKKYKDFLNRLLPQVGTGMHSIDVERIAFPVFFGEDDQEKMIELEGKLKGKRNFVPFIKNKKEYLARKHGEDFFVEKVKTFNSDANGNLIDFEPEEQSDGTRRLLDLIPAIHHVSNKPAVFFIDEIERSLHPTMIKELLRYFMEYPSKGQLIFTTHESNLLDLEIFRQDEIWLTEKSQSGSTTIYSLSDFKPRYDLDIRKGYLAGRFGAIPFLGNLKDLNWGHAQKQRV